MYSTTEINIDKYTQAFFTEREKDIIHELLKGKLNKEIAGTLGITIHTVKKHTKNIYRKANVRNRIEAVHYILYAERA